jgi:methylglutaconyl-CoA hydratase
MTRLAQFPLETVLHEGETLRAERLAHGVRRIVLNRPQVCNAFNAAMVQELSRAFTDLATREARLLLLEGEGAAFCSGADLAYMKDQGAAPPEQNLENARELARMFSRLASFPVPVVCCVRGAAIGGGMGLTVCSDFVLADPSAIFALSEVMLGLVPSVIGPYVVRKLGLAQAAPLMLTGRRVRASEALGTGLVQRLIEPSETMEDALNRVLREFLAAGPQAARATRELLRRISPLPDPELMDFTARTIAAARTSAEGQEGLQAYFQKVPPPWAVPPERKD